MDITQQENTFFFINELNSIANLLNVDADLYQDKFLILDEVSLHSRGVRVKYSSHKLLLYHLDYCRFKYCSIALSMRLRKYFNSLYSMKLAFRAINLLFTCFCFRAGGESRIVIWLILPVVIRLSQGLSHACLSIKDL